MTCRLRKARKPLQESFVYIWMFNQGVKHRLFLGKYRLKVVKLKDSKANTEIPKFQNITKRYQENRERFKNPNLVITKVAKIIKCQPHRESNRLLSVKSIKKEKEKGACHIKLF